jgi:hypothetical protein
VCPPTLIEAMNGALTGTTAPATGGPYPRVTWQGAGHAHRFRACAAAVGGQHEPPLAEAVLVSEDVPPSLRPLGTHSSVQRGRVTDLASGRQPGGQASGEGPVLDADLVAGRAVHRLLAHADPLVPQASLRARVLADLEPDEHLVIPDADTFARDVVALVEGVWQDAPLRQALASPAARFEVPIVFRHEEAGMVQLVRGTIDCLVPDGTGLLVLEFKTGRPQPAHRRQLALYVDAVRALRPGIAVRGRLVYATRPDSPRPMTTGRLPFDA